MATERTRLIELVLVRYRDSEEADYLYVWIEKMNREAVSDYYETEEDALNWYKRISEKTNEGTHWTIRKLDWTLSDR